MPTMDTFATKKSAVLPSFLSWRQESGAAGVDSFSVSAWHKAVWLFPPPPLAMAAMREFMRRPEVQTALLIVPEWTAQPYWPHAQLLSHGQWVRLPPDAVSVPASASVHPRSWCCFSFFKPSSRA